MILASNVGTPTATNTINTPSVQLYSTTNTADTISHTKVQPARYGTAWDGGTTAKQPCHASGKQTTAFCQHEPPVLCPVDLDHAALSSANRAASAVECCCALAAAAHVPALHIHHLRGRAQAHHTHPSCRVLAAVWLIRLQVSCAWNPANDPVLLQSLADTFTCLVLSPAPHYLPGRFPDHQKGTNTPQAPSKGLCKQAGKQARTQQHGRPCVCLEITVY